ncbi:hypothetical protein [Roseateles sp.]|uniref:hypothetical protein n=1 Tax=Roseateles sp. TaxID=1971397 RepID=UPI0039E92CE8
MLRSQFIYVKVIRGQASALAVETGERAAVLSSAFAHPRTLMGDFKEVVAGFRRLLNQLGHGAWYRRKPWALVHLVPSQEGGYTNVELRAFRGAMLEAGCEQVFLLDSREPPLSDAQLAEVKKEFGRTVLFSD